MNRPNLWGVGFNKRGLWFGTPRIFAWHAEFKEYLDETETYGVFGNGLLAHGETTTFASETRQDVVAFIKKTKEELND